MLDCKICLLHSFNRKYRRQSSSIYVFNGRRSPLFSAQGEWQLNNLVGNYYYLVSNLSRNNKSESGRLGFQQH